MDIKEYVINNKEVFVCEEHHHVLIHWHKFKTRQPYLLTFDHHTDLHSCFQHYLYYNTNAENRQEVENELIKKIVTGDIDSILKLKHDEHVDASIKAGIIKNALVFSDDSYSSKPNRVYCISGNESYNNEPIIVNTRSHDDYDLSISDNNIKDHFKRFELCLPIDSWIDNFILDIDLDFFKTCKSIEAIDNSLFKFLISKSITITIAKETIWVNIWKRDHDDSLSVDFLLDKLFKMIEETSSISHNVKST